MDLRSVGKRCLLEVLCEKAKGTFISLETFQKIYYHRYNTHLPAGIWRLARTNWRLKMNETYVEWLVKKKTPAYMTLLRILSIMLAALFILVGFVIIPALLIGIAIGVAAYFIYLNSDLEYEYLYVDKELTVDKVMAKTRRKRVAAFELDKMEIVAPLKSWHLDNFKNRNDKTVDYSSGVEKQPEVRYVFYYEGNKKVIFEPNDEMVKAMQLVAPRKVFRD